MGAQRMTKFSLGVESLFSNFWYTPRVVVTKVRSSLDRKAYS